MPVEQEKAQQSVHEMEKKADALFHRSNDGVAMEPFSSARMGWSVVSGRKKEA